MTIEEKIKEVSELHDAHSPEGRMKRFDDFLDFVLQNTPGDIIEIGAGFGLTTKILLKHAKAHGRKVIVIDPFLDPVYPIEAFYDAVREYDNMLLVKQFAYKLNLINAEWLYDTPIAFAFVDGLQIFSASLTEIGLCGSIGAKIICPDDMNRQTVSSRVPDAVRSFLTIYHTYTQIQTRPLIEGYLIRK